MLEFQKFNKIPRLSRDILISEKIDGSNAQVAIFNGQDIQDYLYHNFMFNSLDLHSKFTEIIDKYCLYIHPENPYIQDEEDKLYLFAGSRKRWLSCDKKGDNHGFALWVKEHALELVLGLHEGRNFGEWFGRGINANYGLDEKRFALFNVHKWADSRYVPEAMLEENQEWCPECCNVVPILYQGIFDSKKIEEVLEDLKQHGSYAVNGFKPAEGVCVLHKASGKLFKKTILNDEYWKGRKH